MDRDVLLLVFFVAALVLLDVIALRFGVDSRPRAGERPDW